MNVICIAVLSIDAIKIVYILVLAQCLTPAVTRPTDGT